MSPPNASMAVPQPAPANAPGTPIGLGREVALVATGGAVGALLRSAVATRLADVSAPFPESTQLVNAVGAFALGLLLAGLEGGRPRPGLRCFLAVGVLGSFTTFSTLVDDGRTLATNRSPALALAFLVLSLAVGLLAFRLGRRIGSAIGGARGGGDGTSA